MKIRVTKCSNPAQWYAGYIGQEFETNGIVHNQDIYSRYLVKRGKEHGYGWCVPIGDCEIVREPLERLNIVLSEMSVEALRTYADGIQEHINTRSKSRVFGQEDYERVVTKLRACDRRVKFEPGMINYCLEMESGCVKVGEYRYVMCGLWQVYFAYTSTAQQALLDVGEENILKAVEYESGIGL